MKHIFTAIVVVISVMVLIFMAHQVAQNPTIPSLENLMASTTEKVSIITSMLQNATTTDATHTIVSTPNGPLYVTLARTDAEREQGLSGVLSLPSDQGKLFIFSVAQLPGFWMKDMHIPLDMVWIDASSTVVGVTNNISPDTYPDIFYPPALVTSVLEINAGSAQKFGIATGTVLGF